jgi:hypothetical protein
LNTLYIGNKRRFASRGIEKAGLEPEEIRAAEREFRADYPDRKNVPDWAYRKKRTEPLLIVHALRIDLPTPKGDPARPDPDHEDPVIAWSMSFPSTKLASETVRYVVNTRGMLENYGSEMDDDEGLDGEDS